MSSHILLTYFRSSHASAVHSEPLQSKINCPWNESSGEEDRPLAVLASSLLGTSIGDAATSICGTSTSPLLSCLAAACSDLSYRNALEGNTAHCSGGIRRSACPACSCSLRNTRPCRHASGGLSACCRRPLEASASRTRRMCRSCWSDWLCSSRNEGLFRISNGC